MDRKSDQIWQNYYDFSMRKVDFIWELDYVMIESKICNLSKHTAIFFGTQIKCNQRNEIGLL